MSGFASHSLPLLHGPWLSVSCPGFPSRSRLSVTFPAFPSRKPCFSIRCPGFPSCSLPFCHVPWLSLRCPGFPSPSGFMSLAFTSVSGFASVANTCLSTYFPCSHQYVRVCVHIERAFAYLCINKITSPDPYNLFSFPLPQRAYL